MTKTSEERIDNLEQMTARTAQGLLKAATVMEHLLNMVISLQEQVDVLSGNLPSRATDRKRPVMQDIVNEVFGGGRHD